MPARICPLLIDSPTDYVLLLARTDARTSRGFDEALTRLKAFVAEDADTCSSTKVAATGGKMVKLQ